MSSEQSVMTSSELKKRLTMNFTSFEDKIELVRDVVGGKVKVAMPGTLNFMLSWLVDSMGKSAKYLRKKAGTNDSFSISGSSALVYPPAWSLLTLLLSQATADPSSAVAALDSAVQTIPWVVAFVAPLGGPDLITVIRPVVDLIIASDVPVDRMFVLVTGIASLVTRHPDSHDAVLWLSAALDAVAASAAKSTAHRSVFLAGVQLVDALCGTVHALGSKAVRIEHSVHTLFSMVLFHPEHLADFQLAFSNPMAATDPRTKAQVPDKDAGKGAGKGAPSKSRGKKARKSAPVNPDVHRGAVKSYQRALFDTLEKHVTGGGPTAAAASTVLVWLFEDYVVAVMREYAEGHARFSGSVMGRFSLRTRVSGLLRAGETSSDADAHDAAFAEEERRRLMAAILPRQLVAVRKAHFSFFSEVVSILLCSEPSPGMWAALEDTVNVGRSYKVYARDSVMRKDQTGFMRSLVRYVSDAVLVADVTDPPPRGSFAILAAILDMSYTLVEPVLSDVLPATLMLAPRLAAGASEFSLITSALGIFHKLNELPKFLNLLTQSLDSVSADLVTLGRPADAAPASAFPGWPQVLDAFRGACVRLLPGAHMWSVWGSLRATLVAHMGSGSPLVFCALASLAGVLAESQRVAGPSAARVVTEVSAMAEAVVAPLLAGPASGPRYGAALLLYTSLMSAAERANDQSMHPFSETVVKSERMWFAPWSGAPDGATCVLDLPGMAVALASGSDLSPMTVYGAGSALIDNVSRLHDLYMLVVKAQGVAGHEAPLVDDADSTGASEESSSSSSSSSLSSSAAAYLAGLSGTRIRGELDTMVDALAQMVGSAWEAALASGAWPVWTSPLALLSETAGSSTLLGLWQRAVSTLDVLSHYGSEASRATWAQVALASVAVPGCTLATTSKHLLARSEFVEVRGLCAAIKTTAVDMLTAGCSDVGGDAGLTALTKVLAQWPTAFWAWTDDEVTQWQELLVGLGKTAPLSAHAAVRSLLVDAAGLSPHILSLMTVKKVTRHPLGLDRAVVAALMSASMKHAVDTGAKAEWVFAAAERAQSLAKKQPTALAALTVGGLDAAVEVFAHNKKAFGRVRLLKHGLVPLAEACLGVMDGMEDVTAKRVLRTIMTFEHTLGMDLRVDRQALYDQLFGHFHEALGNVLRSGSSAGVSANLEYVHAFFYHMAEHAMVSEEVAAEVVARSGSKRRVGDGTATSSIATLSAVMLAYGLALVSTTGMSVSTTLPSRKDIAGSAPLLGIDALAAVVRRMLQLDSPVLLRMIKQTLLSEVMLSSAAHSDTQTVAGRLGAGITLATLVYAPQMVSQYTVVTMGLASKRSRSVESDLAQILMSLAGSLGEVCATASGEVQGAAMSAVEAVLVFMTQLVRNTRRIALSPLMLGQMLTFITSGVALLPSVVSAGPDSVTEMGAAAASHTPSSRELAMLTSMVQAVSAALRIRTKASFMVVGPLIGVVQSLIRAVLFEAVAASAAQRSEVSTLVSAFTKLMGDLSRHADSIRPYVASIIPLHVKLTCELTLPSTARLALRYAIFQVFDTLDEDRRRAIFASLQGESTYEDAFRVLNKEYKRVFKFGGVA